MAKTVAILNWAGHGNFGDELILEGLRQLFKGWELFSFSSDSNGCYPQFNFSDVNKCDLFVLGGGELVNKRFLWMPYPCSLKVGSRIYRLYAHTPFAQRSWIKLITIPKVILGCGVDVAGPEELDENVVRDLEQFQYIGLRDKVAVEILESFPKLKPKVHLFYDLAFAINMSTDTCRFLAKVFPFKLHGLILAHIAGTKYAGQFYHPKVGRVYETIKGLKPQRIREEQKAMFGEVLKETKSE